MSPGGRCPCNRMDVGVYLAVINSWRLDKAVAQEHRGLPVWERRCHPRGMLNPNALAILRSFRQELYDDLGLRQDSLFELVDAVLTAPERRTLVRLSLCPCFRRRWPSTCDALADGTLDMGGLRALFQAHVPLPGPGERPLWALDGTHWPRPAAATSPARTWEHRPLPGKPQQGVVPAWAYHWLVQVPEVEGSWVLPLDVQRRGPTAGTPTQMAIRQIAQACAGQ